MCACDFHPSLKIPTHYTCRCEMLASETKTIRCVCVCVAFPSFNFIIVIVYFVAQILLNLSLFAIGVKWRANETYAYLWSENMRILSNSLIGMKWKSCYSIKCVNNKKNRRLVRICSWGNQQWTEAKKMSIVITYKLL